MKKLTVIGGAIFSVGLIALIISFALVGWNFEKLSTRPPFEEKQYSIKNSDQTVTVRDKNTHLAIGLSPDDQIHFTYFERDKEHYNIDANENIRFEKKIDYKMQDYFFVFDAYSSSFTVLLPKEFSGNLDLETVDGKILISNVNATDILAKTSDGKIEISDLNLSGKLDVSTKDSSVTLNNIVADNIFAKTTDGKFVATNTQSNDNISLSTSNNNIEIENICAANNILLKTNDGKITGYILGDIDDYSITSKTTDATNNLPENSGGNKSLNVKTTNGEIEIFFAKN